MDTGRGTDSRTNATREGEVSARVRVRVSFSVIVSGDEVLRLERFIHGGKVPPWLERFIHGGKVPPRLERVIHGGKVPPRLCYACVAKRSRVKVMLGLRGPGPVPVPVAASGCGYALR